MRGRSSRGACRWEIGANSDITPWLYMREIEVASMTGQKELHHEWAARYE